MDPKQEGTMENYTPMSNDDGGRKVLGTTGTFPENHMLDQVEGEIE